MPKAKKKIHSSGTRKEAVEQLHKRLKPELDAVGKSVKFNPAMGTSNHYNKILKEKEKVITKPGSGYSSIQKATKEGRYKK